MGDNGRRQLRTVIRLVHPDLFSAHPHARGVNAESLKVRQVVSALPQPTMAGGQRPNIASTQGNESKQCCLSPLPTTCAGAERLLR